MKRVKKISVKLLLTTRRLPIRQKMIALSVIIGFIVGLLAVLMKTIVFAIIEMLTGGFDVQYNNYQYLVFPAIGILATVIFIKFVLRRPVRDGIPNVLYSISKQHGIIDKHNTFSSIITAALTVGFGGSVGLEGPTVVTGAAYGSRIGKLLGLNYKQTVSLLGFASAAAMAAIFKAPVAAIVFALEVILFDMTMSALVPLLFASITAALTSYFFLGQTVLYPFDNIAEFKLNQTIYYFGLGIFAALVSTYFIKIYVFSGWVFDKIKGWIWKFLIGVGLLGLLIFLLPSLYGEGYEAVNSALKGDIGFIFDNSIFYDYKDNIVIALLLLSSIIIFKAIATSLTFRAGGVGGIFAPTLFIGTMTGLLFVQFLNHLGITHLPVSSFALVGMAGLLAGVVHAPLTAIFLIAEITGGYKLFFPIMIVAATSYAFTKFLSPRSIYTIQLKNRGDVITHHKDNAMLSMMRIDELIEKNFDTIDINANLRELVAVIAKSHRNVFPVVENGDEFRGIIILDQIRDIMFKPDLYDETMVSSLMFTPAQMIHIEEDDMETVATKFQHSGTYNLVVLNGDKYVGFVSRANVFSKYREILRSFSEE
ncbi:MAG: chloride channel protein [Marinilabiliales bacterium]|nr:MAG: chloride channel protein [Marinilabiliales bacterium]